MELVKGACRERIYPVGRMDRSTTGLLFFTNDGALAKNLPHPRHGVRKIYHAESDKTLRQEDFEKILGGVILEDGKAEVDELFYVEGENKKIGITLHVGKNRIVRRIFESLDYRVTRLDRVNYAGLTKKDLLRGRWRMLTEKEVGFLKMIAGRENKLFLPLISEPTFSPMLAHQISRCETSGGLWRFSCNLSLSPIHSRNFFMVKSIAHYRINLTKKSRCA